MILGNLGEQVDKYGSGEESVDRNKFRRSDWEYITEKPKCPDADLEVYPTSSKKLLSDFKRWSNAIKLKLSYIKSASNHFPFILVISVL